MYNKKIPLGSVSRPTMELLVTEAGPVPSDTLKKELPIEEYRDAIAAQLGDKSRPGNTWIAFPHIPPDRPE